MEPGEGSSGERPESSPCQRKNPGHENVECVHKSQLNLVESEY